VPKRKIFFKQLLRNPLYYIQNSRYLCTITVMLYPTV